MDIVLRESDRLNQTIRSFLAYARPKRATLGRCDLGQVVRDTARLLQNGADVRPGHRVEVDLPPDPVWCETDENQVRQILWNLATNGLRSMAAGGRLRMAVLETPEVPGDVGIVVEDEGCGILPADLDHIFEPFHSTFERGTGLGLATVHRIVTELGGTIQVNSRVGHGTTMRVRLPQRRGTGRCRGARAAGGRVSAGTIERASHPPSETATARPAARVLVVDDEASMRDMLRIVLRRDGYQVLVAEGARAAAAILEREAIDLLLSDIRMPDGSGVDVLRAAKQANADVVAFMMTAFASTETAVEAMRLGAVDYFTKPFNVDELRLKIRPAPRDAAPEGRERRPQARPERVPRVLEHHRPQPGDAGPVPADRNRGPDLQHGADHGRVGHRQGDGGQGDSRQLASPRPPVRGAQLRGRSRDAARVRAVRPPPRGVHRRGFEQEGAHRDCRGRHHLPRRDRGNESDDAGEAVARAPGTALPPAGRHRRGAGRHPRSWWPRTRTCRGWWPMGVSGRTCTTGSTSSRCSCPPCASDARTFRCWPSASCTGLPRRWGRASPESPVTRCASWRTTTGRGTSGNCRT